MMDAVVQMIRNGLCCIKDLELLQSNNSLNVLWDASYTATYYDLPEPLDKTTPLEALISLSQAYAFYSTTTQGWAMISSSYGKIRRIARLLEARVAATTGASGGGGNSTTTSTTTTTTTTDADRLINASLIKEMKYAIRSLFIGTNVFFIGACFFWLVGNSWHVTETDWIGGIQAVIIALTIMEICLVPLLYYMWMDAGEQFVKCKRMTALALQMQEGNLTQQDMGLSSFEALTGWLPFWDAGVSVFETAIDAAAEEKLVALELKMVDKSLAQLVGQKGDGEKETKVRKQHLQRKADELLASVAVTGWEGYREYLYFVLNCVAFYGYLVGIIVYYWDDEQKQPAWVQKGLLLGMANTHADWHGNFAGDLMWTIEPAIIMGSPILFNYMKPKPAKLKAD